ncbi:hypothetical protein [Erythrobacter sp. BLCC-B19]|uniref:hypothetical protein n=1 Tax=Erythrobacter sp. BLCC-B19 TaxID=3025315 RepID=UPI00235E82A4|nr:hypothetical protein [Erythrobacter sp. BLCC-B19]WDA42779.1 hypothetical protein PS060_08230 [Erythrobacter sp. BLCC-B19]
MIDLLEFFNSYRVLIQHLFAFALAGAIWRWGAGPERWTIGVFLATMVLPIYVIWWVGGQSYADGSYDLWYFVIDVVAVGLYLLLALHANRNYPLWIAGLQLVSVVAHLSGTLVDTINPFALAVLVIGPSYGALIVLTIGFWRHRFRERRYGQYREWRLSPPSLAWLRP